MLRKSHLETYPAVETNVNWIALRNPVVGPRLKGIGYIVLCGKFFMCEALEPRLAHSCRSLSRFL